jgi:hypothetical protein
VLNNGFAYLDRQGHTISSADAVQLCSSVAKGCALNFNVCLQQQRTRLLNLYQPAGRFWLFQGIESAIFLGLAAILLALAVWWVMTRLTQRNHATALLLLLVLHLNECRPPATRASGGRAGVLIILQSLS